LDDAKSTEPLRRCLSGDGQGLSGRGGAESLNCRDFCLVEFAMNLNLTLQVILRAIEKNE
jgi:hypothetical protein